MNPRSTLIENLLVDAVEILSDHLSNQGCNDLCLPNDPEIRALWKEFNEWNSGATDSSHPEWIDLHTHPDQQQLIGVDAFYIFLIKKNLGML